MLKLLRRDVGIFSKKRSTLFFDRHTTGRPAPSEDWAASVSEDTTGRDLRASSSAGIPKPAQPRCPLPGKRITARTLPL